MPMKTGKYFRIGLAAATLIGGATACQNTIFDNTYKGEGNISNIYNKDGYQIVEVDIRRDAGDSFEPPPFIMPSPTVAPIHLVLATKKPIKGARAGDRLKFRYRHDKDRNAFEKSISGWMKLNGCKVYPRR